MPVQVHYTSEFFYDPLPGGLMQFKIFGPGLVKRDVQPNVLTLRSRPELSETESTNGLWVKRLPPPQHLTGGTMRGVHQQRCWLLRRALAECSFTKHQRHVLQPNALSWQMWPVLLRARRQGIPVVHTITIAPETKSPSSGLAAIRHRIAMHLTFSLVPHIAMLSGELSRVYQRQCGVRKDQISIIPNGIDVQRFAPLDTADKRDALRDRFEIPRDAKIVLFVGGLMPRKGVDLLLNCWNTVRQHNPNAILLFVGSTGVRESHRMLGLHAEIEMYATLIEQLKGGLNAPSSVRFLGEQADPVPFFQIADLFAFPSHREGLPTAVLEAMACGLPCLVTPFIGLPATGEEMGYADTHYVMLERDPDLWAHNIVELLADASTSRRTEIGTAARSWIVETNNLERTLDLWAALYHNDGTARKG